MRIVGARSPRPDVPTKASKTPIQPQQFTQISTKTRKIADFLRLS